MFTDQVTFECSAGKGGNGVVAWRREKFIRKGGPCGGNGGRGGSVVIKGSNNIYCLDKYRHRKLMKAQHGGDGGINNRQGRQGDDLVVIVPCGTQLKDPETDEVIMDIVSDGQTFDLCVGGKGGKGNTFFKSSTNQAPTKCTMGKPGQSCKIKLELKLIADVGFVGMPNAGKSTLLSRLTARQVKIADYPFTTLKPNLSYIQFDDFSRIYIADIPGIIKDAHKDRGLGLEFLRHIERSKVLVYVIDLSGIDGRDPFTDFATLQEELRSYDPALLDQPFLVLLNKIDTPEGLENHTQFCQNYPHAPDTLCTISALDGTGITDAIEKMRTLAQQDGKVYV
ncbi:MAG: GTPase Obg [Chlamydiia bacterium]|nr:GTPase Obg [Chlamydiia bacterium]